MDLFSLVRRSLRHHWRMNLAVVLAVVAGSAALTGALLVGDSMRGSLRAVALRRLGPVDYAWTSPRFFREALADRIAESQPFKSAFSRACPLISLEGSSEHAASQARANHIKVLGVDDRFWGIFAAADGRPADPSDAGAYPAGRTVALSPALADALRARVGDDVLIRVTKSGQAPVETLLGRRDEAVSTIRLTVSRVLSEEGAGQFVLEPRQQEARNAFVPLALLQQAVAQPGRANTILVAGREHLPSDTATETAELRSLMDRHLALADLGLLLRRSEAMSYITLESDRLLVEPAVEALALRVSDELGLTPVPVSTYLANSISKSADPSAPGVPYSTIAALSQLVGVEAETPSGRASEQRRTTIPDDAIVLNQWAADDLGAAPGDPTTLTYYVSKPFGELETRQATLRLAAVVPISGWAADPGLTPTYEGITDAKRISDWNPPFPVDMKRIRPKDEDYWDRHKALPKAFVSAETGRRLWADPRFGSLTSIRIVVDDPTEWEATQSQFEAALLKAIDPASFGLSPRPVRAEALAAGGGSTDFGLLFIGFSSFIIISAAMLVALTFRLGIERRAPQLGILLATGFTVRRVGRMLLAEGAFLAAIGAGVGMFAAVVYASAMIAALRSWWSQPIRAPFLELSVAPMSLVIGYVAGVAVALASIALTIRKLAASSPRALLAGETSQTSSRATRGRPAATRVLMIGLLAVAAVLCGVSYVSAAVSEAGAFFGAGAAMLAALLAGCRLWLRRPPQASIGTVTGFSIPGLAIRNATRRPSRSLLAIGLVASASFVIVAVGANRRSPEEDAASKTGGTGGFALLGESVLPLPYDLGTRDGRRALGLSEEDAAALDGAAVMSLRLRPGDDSSCLNLYQALRPRILGAGRDMIDRGGFRFSAAMAETSEERRNPWTLLDRSFADGAVPAIGDENAVRWLLHLGLGDDLAIVDDRDEPARLRIVGMLAGSTLQGELIVSEDRFKALFPSIGGHGFFLIESGPNKSRKVEIALERVLARFGMEVESSQARLESYLAVENTYISTFQTLGGIGLILGTFGLAAVMLRNVMERRGEMALLRALGHRVGALLWMVVAELALLLLSGLAIGCVSAMVAVAPHLVSSSSAVPWDSLGLTLLAVVLVGLSAGAVALGAALRAPLIPALRAE